MRLATLLRCAAALGVVALTGCQAGPVTVVTVTEDSTTYTIGAVFTDEAAQAVRDSVAQLEEVLLKYSPGPVQVQDEDGRLAVFAPVDESQLASAAPLTGVESVRVETGEETRVEANLLPAGELEEVILAAVAGEDDSEVLGPLLVQNTAVQLRVEVDGTFSYSNLPEAVLTGGTATLTRPLAAPAATWQLRAQPGQVNWVLIAGVGVVALGAAGLVTSFLRSKRR